jgi:hypothetical protein
VVVSIRQNSAEWQKDMVLIQLQMGTGKEAKPKSSVQPQLEMMA